MNLTDSSKIYSNDTYGVTIIEMENYKTNQALNRSIEESGLSVITVNILRMMGYSKVSDLLFNDSISYEKLNERFIGFSKLFCDRNVSLEDLQHSYIELTQYLRYYGVIFDEENNIQKTIIR